MGGGTLYTHIMTTCLDKTIIHGDPIVPNVTNQSLTMIQALIDIGYSPTTEETGVYFKDLPSGYKIKAFVNGKGVILHLADKSDRIITRTKLPAIYPTKQIDNPSDIPYAEKELSDQLTV